jgi:hypothetical protein
MEAWKIAALESLPGWKEFVEGGRIGRKSHCSMGGQKSYEF